MQDESPRSTRLIWLEVKAPDSPVCISVQQSGTARRRGTEWREIVAESTIYLGTRNAATKPTKVSKIEAHFLARATTLESSVSFRNIPTKSLFLSFISTPFFFERFQRHFQYMI